MALLRNAPPLRLGELVKITSTTIDELAELHIATCARYADRNVDGIGGMFRARRFADFIDHQRRQYQALMVDRENYLGNAAEIIRRALRQVNELWADPPRPPSIIASLAEAPAAAQRSAPTGEAPARAEPTFELFEDQTGAHRFRLIAPDGTELLTSQAYKSRNGAANGIEVVRRNAVSNGRYQRMETDSGRPMFNLKAGNHQIVATSIPYISTSSMEHALQMVKVSAATAPIVDR